MKFLGFAALLVCLALSCLVQLVFGLNEIPFPIKEPASHAAYIAWLKMLSRTFPGETPRQMLQELFEAAVRHCVHDLLHDCCA